jgi:GxxExxY protein
VLRTFFSIYNELGVGFVESVYHNSMLRALLDEGLGVRGEHQIEVYFRKAVVGQFHADLVVEDCVVLELKAVRTLLPEHNAQLINYLRASWFEVGLVLNFGRVPEFKRLIFSNSNKKGLDPR